MNKLDYGALNTLWVVVFVLAPGIFLPLEQEVGRAMAARRVHGIGGAPIVRRASAIGGAFAVAIAIGVIFAAFTTSLVSKLFAGHAGLVVCLVIALFTFGIEYLARGAFAGTGHFGAYGVSMAAEALLRLAPCIPLALVGATNPVWFGLCLAIPPLIATAIALHGRTGIMVPGPPAPYREISTNLGYLLGGSLFAQLLGYAPFIGATLLATSSQRVAVADFIVGLFLSRIPIVLFQAVQAALLPGLTQLVSAGRADEFRVGVRRLVVLVAGIARARRDRGLDRRADRRPHALREQVQPRQPRRCVARHRQRPVHHLPHHVAGIDRTLGSHVHDVRLVGRVSSRSSSTTAVISHELFLRVELGSIAGALAQPGR